MLLYVWLTRNGGSSLSFWREMSLIFVITGREKSSATHTHARARAEEKLY